MLLLKRFVSGLRALIARTRQEQELDEELQSYLDIATDRKMAAGLPYDAAARAARAELGSIEAIKDHVRDAGWEANVDTFLRDVRFGIRSLLRSPRVSVPALVTLALGIGATVAMFSVVRTVLLEPLPYRDPDRVVAVWETTRGGGSRNGIAPANFVVWRERARTLEHLGMVGARTLVMVHAGEPLQVGGLAVSADVYDALGVRPALGRAYTSDEDASQSVMILSYEFWQRAFAGRADVLGITVPTDGQPRTVIGVMPPRFTIAGQRADFLVPHGATIEEFRAARGRGGAYAVARLRDGVTFDDAYSEMRAIYATLEKEEPARNASRTVMLFRLTDQMVADIRPALVTLMAVVALMLVVSCLNVANLLLARGSARAREMAMRTALGAGRVRLLWQMFTEALVLAAAGGVAGLGVAALLHRGLVVLLGDRIFVPRLDQATVDLQVVAVACVVALLTAVLFGVVPALISVRAASNALRETGRHVGSRRLHRVLNTLVVVEVAISVVLLIGSGLLIRSFSNQRSIQTGYRIEGVLTARVQLPARGYNGTRATTLFRDMLAGFETLPGVRNVSAAACLPPPGGCAATTVWRLDVAPPPDGQRTSSQIRAVSPAFFETMAIPVLAGRDFSDADTAESRPVAIVSESAVRDYFAGQNPLESRLHINNIDHANGSADMPWTVVGVVPDVRSSVDGTASRIVYVPIPQMPGRNATFFIYADGQPLSHAGSVTRIVRSMEPEAPVAVRTLEDVVAGTIARPRVVTLLVTAFALLTLTLAATGVYGVIAYSVRERTREIGVRLALGATARIVGGMLLGQTLRLAAIGALAGSLGASALAPALAGLLFNVNPLDPWTFMLAPSVILTVAAIASYVPARRGMYLPPADVLRAT